jgi:hypothetical protein
MSQLLARWLLAFSAIVFVASVGFSLFAHGSFIAVMVDMLVASVIWK